MSGRTTPRKRGPARDSDACRTSGSQAPPMGAPDAQAPDGDPLAGKLGSTRFKVTKNAQSEEISIPGSVAEKLGVRVGERLLLVRTQNGFALVADSEFNEGMRHSRRIMDRDHAFLAELSRK